MPPAAAVRRRAGRRGIASTDSAAGSTAGAAGRAVRVARRGAGGALVATASAGAAARAVARTGALVATASVGAAARAVARTGTAAAPAALRRASSLMRLVRCLCWATRLRLFIHPTQDSACGGSRIRTCEALSATDLQSVAINHSAIPPRERIVAHACLLARCPGGGVPSPNTTFPSPARRGPQRITSPSGRGSG